MNCGCQKMSGCGRWEMEMWAKQRSRRHLDPWYFFFHFHFSYWYLFGTTNTNTWDYSTGCMACIILPIGHNRVKCKRRTVCFCSSSFYLSSPQRTLGLLCWKDGRPAFGPNDASSVWIFFVLLLLNKLNNTRTFFIYIPEHVEFPYTVSSTFFQRFSAALFQNAKCDKFGTEAAGPGWFEIISRSTRPLQWHSSLSL